MVKVARSLLCCYFYFAWYVVCIHFYLKCFRGVVELSDRKDFIRAFKRKWDDEERAFKRIANFLVLWDMRMWWFLLSPWKVWVKADAFFVCYVFLISSACVFVLYFLYSTHTPPTFIFRLFFIGAAAPSRFLAILLHFHILVVVSIIIDISSSMIFKRDSLLLPIICSALVLAKS